MSTWRKIFYPVVLLVISLFSPSRSFSQITVTSGDLLGMIGSRQTILEDGRFSITVNVGSAGPGRIWDFRGMAIADSIFAVSEFLSPQSLPSGTRFPESNLAQKITTPSSPGFEIFNFFKITPSSFVDLGDSSKISSPSSDTSFVHFQNDFLAPLPIALNIMWMTTLHDTTGLFPIAANISIDTTINTVDAWGTVRLPLGDFQCLRIRQNVNVINQTILDGMVFSTGTDTYIQYNWVAKNVFLVASAQSQNGETNPNFTDAQSFGRLDSLKSSPTTKVDDTAMLPSSFELLQNYPNPFNPETVIEYQTRLEGPVELVVYNLSGEKVRVLVNGVRPAGHYEAWWDGTDDWGNRVSSGMYIYRLKSGNFAQAKKMVLLQ